MDTCFLTRFRKTLSNGSKFRKFSIKIWIFFRFNKNLHTNCKPHFFIYGNTVDLYFWAVCIFGVYDKL